MERFMPQSVFDACVIGHLTCKEGGKEHLFAPMLAEYRSSYPSEDFESLAHDISSCSEKLALVVGEFFTGVYAGSHKLFGNPYEIMKARKIALFKEMLRLNRKDSRSRQPLWKKVFGGTRFNYEQKPLADRKSQCAKNCFKFMVMAVHSVTVSAQKSSGVSGFPWVSALSLLYPFAATIYIATYTPAPPIIARYGYGLANLGWLLFAAGVLAGTFRVFGLKKRWQVLALAAICFATGTLLSNVG